MIVNNSLTLYHKTIDSSTKLEVYERYFYEKIWWFGGQGVSLNKGLQNVNNVIIRIPYDLIDIDVSNISVGDILVKGRVDLDIEEQSDLKDYEVYIITSINNNTFGSTPHVHIEGK